MESTMIVLFVSFAMLLGAALSFRPIVRAVVRHRLGPSKRVVTAPSDDDLREVGTPRRAAVIGGGLAGISAASTLGERGYDVVLYEAESFLGGKIGSWQTTLPDGSQTFICHGFHAFFRHYYNLNRFLDRLSIRDRFRSIGDYVIVERDGGTLSFEGIETTPILNLLSLARKGVYSMREVMFGPARDLMGIFLEYDQKQTFERLDGISFAEFADAARLPRRLRLAFGTFARAFFADEDRMSLAELVKSFHYYFLGHDGGLVYDIPEGEYETTLLAPIREHLEGLGVELRLGSRAEQLKILGDDGFSIGEEHYDAVVIATHVVGARNLVQNAEGASDELRSRFSDLRPGQRYAVLRLWLNEPFERPLPPFVITERDQFLDAVAFNDRYENDAEAWAKENGGSVMELHCYAVPDEAPDDEAIRKGLISELHHLFPELVGADIFHEDFKVRRDFPAFHVNRHANRPPITSPHPGLVFAGDWVKLDFPAMLMEGAFTSGIVAANHLLEAEGLSPALVESVPPRGVMAGMPWPPAREKWVAAAARVASHSDGAGPNRPTKPRRGSEESERIPPTPNAPVEPA